jgi:hypothetical protein
MKEAASATTTRLLARNWTELTAATAGAVTNNPAYEEDEDDPDAGGDEEGMEGEVEELEEEDPLRVSVDKNLRIKAGEVSSGGEGMSANFHALPTVDAAAVVD